MFIAVLIFQFAVLIVAPLSLIKGLFECGKKKNPYGLCPLPTVLATGAFVWADAVVFGLFWTLALIAFMFWQNSALFFLFLSLFWLIRALGEVVYWIQEQFAVNHRNPPEQYKLYKLFPSDSMWVVYQIFWQCVAVVALIVALIAIRILL